MEDIESVRQPMETAVSRLVEEFKKIRTGRASSHMLDSVLVEVYDQKMPISHVATIVTLDAQMLQVTPYDPANLRAIALAIREDSTLGLNPTDDGRVVRVPVPSLTTERRQQIVKQLHEKAEECKISLRNSRHDTLKSLQKKEKDSEISRDDLTRSEKKLNEIIDDYQQKIQSLVQEKEKEIMTL